MSGREPALSQREAREALDRLFIEASELAATRELVAKVREDEATRERFNALAQAERALESDQACGAFERAFGEAMFLEGLDALLASEAEGAPEVETTRATDARVLRPVWWRTQAARAGAMAASVAIVGAGAWALTRPSDGGVAGPPADTYQARGLATDAPPVEDAQRVGVFCVTTDAGGEARFEGPDEAALGLVQCAQDASIKLAIINPQAQHQYVAVFGVSERGELLWYGPSPAAPAAQRAPQSLTWAPIGETIQLNVNHEVGSVRVHAVFSPTPITYAMLQAQLQAHAPAARFAMTRMPRWAASSSVVFDVTEVPR